MQYLLHRVFCWNFYGMSLEIWAELPELRLPEPKLTFPSLGTSLPLLSELCCNSNLGAVLALYLNRGQRWLQYLTRLSIE